MDLMTDITMYEQAKASLIAQLYADHKAVSPNGSPDMAAFVATAEAAFRAAALMGTLPVNSPLENMKPDVAPHCEAEIAARGLNGIIDSKAATLKDLKDFNGFLPVDACRQLDQLIALLTAGNANLIPETVEDQLMLIEDIKALGASLGDLAQRGGESDSAYEARLRATFDALNITPLEDPGFGVPLPTYPSYCLDQAGFDALADLAMRTAEELTYEAWLASQLGDSCNGAAALLNKKIGYLQSEIDYSFHTKAHVLDEFYLILRMLGETRADFEAVNQQFYEDAKMDGVIPMNPFTAHVPDFPPTCGVDALEDAVRAKVLDYIDAVDCLDFTEKVMCGRLGMQVTDCFNEQNTELMDKDDWNDIYLAALAPVEQGATETDMAYAARILAEYNAARLAGQWTVVPAGDYCALPSTIPGTCTGDNLVTYAGLATLIS